MRIDTLMRKSIIKKVVRFNDYGSLADLISILKAKISHDTKKQLAYDKKLASYITGFPSTLKLHK